MLETVKTMRKTPCNAFAGDVNMQLIQCKTQMVKKHDLEISSEKLYGKTKY